LQGSSLSFNFTVAQDQAAPGDVVTYAIQVTNNGLATVTGLSFSDILPQEFGQPNGGFGQGFNFDFQANHLTWGDKSQNTLLPGQSLTLQYPVQIDTQTDGVQIIDSALLFADGLLQPLEAQAAPMTILTHDKRMTRLDVRGGKASGLDGKITVNLPGGVLPAARAILVRDLSQEARLAQPRRLAEAAG
jgi:uncharacterized repeat protein (TIGR01451 family)